MNKPPDFTMIVYSRDDLRLNFIEQCTNGRFCPVAIEPNTVSNIADQQIRLSPRRGPNVLAYNYTTEEALAQIREDETERVVMEDREARTYRFPFGNFVLVKHDPTAVQDGAFALRFFIPDQQSVPPVELWLAVTSPYFGSDSWDDGEERARLTMANFMVSGFHQGYSRRYSLSHNVYLWKVLPEPYPGIPLQTS